MVILFTKSEELKNVIFSSRPILQKINSNIVGKEELKEALGAQLELLPKLKAPALEIIQRATDRPKEVEAGLHQIRKWIKKAHEEALQSLAYLRNRAEKDKMESDFVTDYLIFLDQFKEFLAMYREKSGRSSQAPTTDGNFFVDKEGALQSDKKWEWVDEVEKQILQNHPKPFLALRIALFHVRLVDAGQWDSMGPDKRMELAVQTFSGFSERSVRGQVNRLDPKSSEDRKKYKSPLYVEEAWELYKKASKV